MLYAFMCIQQSKYHLFKTNQNPSHLYLFSTVYKIHVRPGDTSTMRRWRVKKVVYKYKKTVKTRWYLWEYLKTEVNDQVTSHLCNHTENPSDFVTNLSILYFSFACTYQNTILYLFPSVTILDCFCTILSMKFFFLLFYGFITK